MAVSRRLRYEILRRDNYTCYYCGAKAPDVPLTVDHVVPLALGGSDEASNLVTACKDCNAGKSSTNPDAPLVAGVDGLAARYALAYNQVVKERAAKFATEQEHIRWFHKEWCKWSLGDLRIRRDSNWETSIARFLGAGLSRDFLERALTSAMGNSTVGCDGTWKYFCKICWREVKTIRELASRSASGMAAEEEEVDNELPLMEMFDAFLDHLVTAFGGEEIDRKSADHALWSGMPVADLAWRKSGLDAACDAFSEHITPDMTEIMRRRRGDC